METIGKPIYIPQYNQMPRILIQMLPRVAERGYVSMPSKFTELRRGVEVWHGLHEVT